MRVSTVFFLFLGLLICLVLLSSVQGLKFRFGRTLSRGHGSRNRGGGSQRKVFKQVRQVIRDYRLRSHTTPTPVTLLKTVWWPIDGKVTTTPNPDDWPIIGMDRYVMGRSDERGDFWKVKGNWLGQYEMGESDESGSRWKVNPRNTIGNRGWKMWGQSSSTRESAENSESSESFESSWEESSEDRWSTHSGRRGEGSRSHEHGRGGKSHGHGRGGKSREHGRGGKKGRGHSHSQSSSSESSVKSWEDFSSEEEQITPSWCLTYCYKWISQPHNFNKIFSTTNLPLFIKKIAAKFYCDQVESRVCNSNTTAPSNETTTDTPTHSTTTVRGIRATTSTPAMRQCMAANDCEADECCVVNSRLGMVCAKLNTIGAACSRQDINGNPIDVFTYRCPCEEGLECHTRSSTRNSTYMSRENFVGRCREPRATTVPTVRPTATTTDPVASNVTVPVPRNCSNHMDCPFFQCCTVVSDLGEDNFVGVCKNFSVEGESCSSLQTFAEIPQIGACPCQNFLQCSQSSTDPSADGVCG